MTVGQNNKPVKIYTQFSQSVSELSFSHSRGSGVIKMQGDHSPDNVKFPNNSLTVRGTPPRHSAC